MPRRLRLHLADGLYHATLRGNHQQPVFHTDSDRHLLNVIVGQALERYEARLHAYCWMTNHLHFLIQVGDKPLGLVMRQIASPYARAFQLKLETSGHLFERRYFARLVSGDSYLLAVLRYIHLNPVAAGLVTAASEYRWSSHHAYVGGGTEGWLTTDFALSLLGSDRRAARIAYRDFMAQGDPAWQPADEDTPLEASLRLEDPRRTTAVSTAPAEATRTLDGLLAETCVRFEVTLDELKSSSRAERLVRARGWLTRQAVCRGAATLSELSRMLGKDRATLRHAMRKLEKADSAPQLPLESVG
jgi:putative transposase